jgi:transcription elongation factor Elf1
MDCKSDVHYYCPICNAEVYETVFVNNEGEVIGCENCAEIKEPHEVLKNETDEW